MSGVQYFKTFNPEPFIPNLPGQASNFDNYPQSVLVDTDGMYWREFIDPAITGQGSSPGVLQEMYRLVPPGTKVQSATAFGREYFAFSDGVHGTVRPLALDSHGATPRPVSQEGPGWHPLVADSATAGSISAGTHQCVVMFLTDSGYLTRPSIPVSWNAAGGKQVTLTNIPLGPSNVIARVFAFTGAGGDNFSTILENVTFPTSVSALVLNDNTSSSVTLDFSDDALFAATPIDVDGNNLFALVPLAPCLGFFTYANRLFAWGELNRVQNLLNLTFMGGGANSTNPAGWAVATSGGQTVTGASVLSSGAGFSFDVYWQITGDGTTNPKGQLTQSCYRDNFGIEILLPSTNYTVFLTAIRLSNTSGNGTLVVDVANGGSVLATANFPLSDLPVDTGNGSGYPQMLSQPFNLTMPGTIPSGSVLRVYATGVDNGGKVAVTQIHIVPTANPYRLVARGSYVNNPESFDGVTGDIGPASDPTPMRDMFVLRDTLYMLTAERLHETNDDPSFEPSGWSIREVARECGSFGVHASTGGEDWRAWAGPTGYRIFEGQFPWKISQEIQTKWDAINLAAQQTIWTCNDPVNRRAYVGVPTGAATSPNQIYVLDYRQLDTAYEIGKGDTIHISFTGKMIASDLARKWTVWNLASNHGAILSRAYNQSQFVIGGPYANIHYLDPAFYTDDDYGQIASEYYSYFFINHEAEMQMGVGSHRKLYTYLTLFVSGVGQLTVTPYAASLTNPYASLPPLTLTLTPGHDIEWPINVLSERASFKFKVTPLQGQTDAYFNLQKMVVKLREDPWMPVRGAI